MFDINEFSSQINSTGLLRQNYFYVVINLPQTLLQNMDDSSSLRLLCFNATLPGTFYATKTGYMRYGYGRKEKYPTSPLFDDIPLRFYVDNEGTINDIFTTWLNSISNYNVDDQYSDNGFYEMSYKKSGGQNNYVTNIDIYMCNEQGDEIVQYTLYDAWPISTENMSLDWNSINSIAQYGVTFTYKDWQSQTFQSSGSFSNSLLDASNFFSNFPQSIGDIKNIISNKSLYNNGLNINLDVAANILNF